MNSDSIRTFVTYYIQGLGERTRVETSGTKWGIDWIAYNVGLARFGKPVRLPFIRSGTSGYPKTKVEAEFGIDLAFLADNARDLTIFVLKDEALTNSSWTKHNFDRDLRMAMAPDLTTEGLEHTTSVTIILAYNKDDEHNGIEAYDRLVGNAPSILRDSITLTFVRWNLSELVEQTIQHILKPSLVPERFFGQLSYLAAQFADFRHGGEPWQTQLVPNFRRLLDDLLKEGASEGWGLTLIPVVLIILRQEGRRNPSLETGWIELIEWSALALWEFQVRQPNDAGVRKAALLFWREFYLSELERFYRTHIAALATEHAIDHWTMGTLIGAVSCSYIAHWHLGRLGLMAIDTAEISDAELSAAGRSRKESLNVIANWSAMVINANRAVFRPVLDIQHIELFLQMVIWRNADRLPDGVASLKELVRRLSLRRLAPCSLPFLDGSNSLDNVFEQVASKPERSVILAQSSFFVLMLLELCCGLPDEDRDLLIPLIHKRLILGAFDGSDPGNNARLNLMSWLPPDNWEREVFKAQMDEGQCVTVMPFATDREATVAQILPEIVKLVEAMRQTSKPLKLSGEVPTAALLLACLRFGRPVPPEMWRHWVFPPKTVAAQE